MESLPDQKIFKYHPDTMQFLRKQYNLDKPGQMDEAINLLDDWIKKQTHFTIQEFPRSYLERQIILDKGSIERAKFQIEKLFTMKTILPNFYVKFDAKNDFQELREYYAQCLLPNLTKDHYRIYCGRALKQVVPARMFTESYILGTLIFEYIRANDYCNGFIGIMDYREVNMIEFIPQINISEMRQLMTLLTEGYQMRLKGIHLLTASKAIELLVTILKQVFSAKIAGRIHVHSNIESLYDHVPKELLPAEFGGTERTIKAWGDDLFEELSTKENMHYLKEIAKAKVDETRRCNGKIQTDELLGMAGSFRTLSVD